MKYFLDITYDGSRFHGWQVQPNGITVQEEIEKALEKILREKTPILGSGRTDTGVHATQQIAHFETASTLEKEDIQYKLNAVLPRSIAINSVKSVKKEAHARFDATARKYHYFIHQKKNPFKEARSYYFPHRLDLEKINEACKIMEKWKDFESLSKVHTEVNHFNCDIYHAEWTEEAGMHLFEIKANRFLRGMVRATVGTLLEIGKGKISIQQFEEILQSKNRSNAGRAVPPHGLYLCEVIYPSDIYIS